jgi:hypothetical protein
MRFAMARSHVTCEATVTRNHNMTTKALFVKLEAKPGKENEVAKFLRDGQGLVQQHPPTTAWFGIRFGPT